jgi:nitric oxide reductase subunit B
MDEVAIAATNELDDPPISPWWARSVLFVMAIGFAGLIAVTMLSYRNAPPIPNHVVDVQGVPLFTGDDIRSGQAVFLKYGLMDNGSVWGHGAYLGPDFSATALHAMGICVADILAQNQHHRRFDALDPAQQAPIRGAVEFELKTNRFDPARNTLVLTPGEATAFREQVPYWKDYFRVPARNGGLMADLVQDARELKQFSAFVTWAAWATAAKRPGANHSYTNNFPYDPLVGNRPTSGAILWSGLSLIMLLGATAVVLLAYGRSDDLGWISNRKHIHAHLIPGAAGPGQRALVKFFVVVSLLFLMQTLVGAATAHYRADPGNFYGFHLERVFPSNLTRTWHLQTAIFWIATAYVAAALFIGRSLRRDEPKGFQLAINLLFAAFVLVIGCSLLGEWAGMTGLLGRWWFYFGNQGWEYLEIGRFWQYLLVAGLFGWFALLVYVVQPKRIENVNVRPLAKLFLFAALAIPVFYVPALFYGAKTNFTVVDTWRFWIIHLWVEGFFEFFATTVVALLFYQIGLTERNTALRIIYLDAILYFLGGLMGTGHHWYFTGQTNVNMALSAMFSAIEVVPLTLLTLDAWGFVRTTRGQCDICNQPIDLPHKWTFRFLIATGFWNFLGAGVFGFLINLPIISYYEVGTMLTPNHGHAAMMGVFGMLAIALTAFVLRQNNSAQSWAKIEPWICTSFWGVNIGLMLMVGLNLFPGGVLQVLDVTQSGYWHARSLEYADSARSHFIEWMRMPGDLVFILFGAFPLVVATTRTWLGLRAKNSEGPEMKHDGGASTKSSPHGSTVVIQA